MGIAVYTYLNNTVKKTMLDAPSSVGIEGFQIDLRAISSGVYTRISMNQQIVIVYYDQQRDFNKTIVLQPKDAYTIGRAGDNRLVFRTKQVTARHAVMYYSESGWVLEDRDSTNGTFVNGCRITQRLMQNGDIVHISGWEFTYKDGTIAFVSTLDTPILNFKPVFAAAPKKKIKYPVFSRAPRVKTVPLSDDYDFVPPGYKSELRQSSLGDQLLSAAPGVAMSALTGNPMAAAMVVPNIIISGKNRKKQKVEFEKREKNRVAAYTQYMAELDRELSEKCTEQAKLFHTVNPSTTECLAIAEERKLRLWERSVFDDDYLDIRLGLGEVKSGLNIRVPRDNLAPVQDELLRKPKEFAEKYSDIQDAPITINIREAITLGVIGLRQKVVDCVNAMVMNIAAHHPYDEVKVVCLYNEQEREQWEWMRWLPHVWNDDKSFRFMATNRQEAKDLLREFDDMLKARQTEIDEVDKYNKTVKLPYYVFVIADKSLVDNHIIMRQLLGNNPYLGAIAILAYNDISLLPNACQSIVECTEGQIEHYSREDYTAKKTCKPDFINPFMLDKFARALAPIRLAKLASESSMPSCVTFLQGYGVKKVDELNVLDRWERSAPFDRIEAPIGIRHGGDQFVFDLHEREYGPHGLIAGTTGYGKSELLQTWLLSMALNYRPDEISYVLIDFKGEGLAGSLEKLPHVAGKISNIDISGIKRNLTALEAELIRRQKVFSETKIKDIYKYQRAFREGKVAEAMSHLIIVIDEFAQMKKDYPEYMNAFTSIARVGRSLGVHLVLCTQSPSGVVDQQVQSNTRFKMCLKTANVGESREMLGKADAVNLTTKGRAIIQVGSDEVYEQVQTFWSGAPYNPGGEFVKSSKKITIVGTMGQRTKPEVYDKTVIVKKSGEEEFNVVVNYIAKEAEKAGFPRARMIWDEALPRKLYLDDLIKDKKAFSGNEFAEVNTGFAPIIGLVDAPDEQTRYPLAVNVGKEGHTVFYGAPGTGKTTLLQTFVISTAFMYTPEQINMYVMDFGNWSMKTLENLPHVGGVANGNENEKIEKLVALFDKELSVRKYAFAAEGVGSIETYREVSGKNLPYMALIVDNFNSVFASYPDLDEFFLRFVKDGGSLGMYLVATSGTINGMGFKIAQYIKQSLALQMIDKSDYITIVGRTEGLEPAKVQGRGLVKEGVPHEYQTALAVKAVSEGEKIKQLRAICGDMNNAWDGAIPAGIPVMPEIITQMDMKSTKEQVEIGLSSEAIKPVQITFKRAWYMMISGMPKCGKSNALRLLLNGLLQDAAAKITVYEPRGKNFIHLEGRIDRIAKPEEFDAFMAELVSTLKERLDQHKAGQSDFDTIAILIDDYEVCFDQADDKTIARLTQITKLAKGLGVYLYIAGKASSMSTLYNQGESLTMQMVSAPYAVALGGDLLNHPNYECDLSTGDKTEAMGSYEGYYFDEGKATKFKAALAGKG